MNEHFKIHDGRINRVDLTNQLLERRISNMRPGLSNNGITSEKDGGVAFGKVLFPSPVVWRLRYLGLTTVLGE